MKYQRTRAVTHQQHRLMASFRLSTAEEARVNGYQQQQNYGDDDDASEPVEGTHLNELHLLQRERKGDSRG